MKIDGNVSYKEITKKGEETSGAAEGVKALWLGLLIMLI
jgi:hypothetical protein